MTSRDEPKDLTTKPILAEMEDLGVWLRRVVIEINRSVAPFCDSAARIAAAIEPAFRDLAPKLQAFVHAVKWWEEQGASEARRAFLAAGYPMSNRLTLGQFLGAARLHDKSGPNLSVKCVNEYFDRLLDDAERIDRIQNDWWEVSLFKERKEILREAFAAHARGLYAAAVPMWISQFEGIALDYVDYDGWQRETELRSVLEDLECREDDLRSLLPELISDQMWREIGQDESAVAWLDRRGILCGKVLDYGTRHNSQRLIIMLDELHSAIRRGSRSLPANKLSASHEAKGIASEIIAGNPQIVGHLKSTMHLGVLANLTTKPFTRLDYVLLQLRNMLLFKLCYRGLGLGSKIGSMASLDKESCPIKGATGLVLLQLWTLIQSWGHLFGTFATERALLWVLKKDPILIQDVIHKIDDRLRPGCSEILRSNRWYSFVNVMSAWRISTEDLNEKHREALIQAHALYLSPEQDTHLLRLKKIFEKVRQLSYLGMQTRAGVGAVEMSMKHEHLVTRLLRRDGVKYHSFAECDAELTELLRGIDEYHYDTFFTGDEASSTVLRHLREFKRWWEGRAQRSDGIDAIGSLFVQPADWPAVDAKEMRQVSKLKIPLNECDWIDETSRWFCEGNPWGENSNFYLAFPPGGGHANVCIYASRLSQPALLHIALNLARLQGQAAHDDELSRSIGSFFLLVFNRLLKSTYEALIEPVEQKGSVNQVALAGSNGNELEFVFRKSASTVLEPQRRDRELLPLCEYVHQQVLQPGGVRIVLIGQLHVLNRNDDKGQLAEIDGAVCDVTNDRAEFHFLEFKKHGAGATPNAQLGRLARLLETECSGPTELPLAGAKAAVLRTTT